MNRESMYESESDDDDIGEDLDDLRRACMVSDPNSENEDDFELLQSIKSQLAPSSKNSGPDSSVHSDSENEEDDDFEMLRSIKNQLELSTELNDVQGNFMNDDSNDQVHAPSGNEHSSDTLSPSNTCESFPDNRGTTFPESGQAFVDAIRINRSYQAFLRKKLTEIESTIEQNEKHKKNVSIVKNFQASCKRITKQALSQSKDPRVELISTPKSGPRTSLTLGPPENRSVGNYKMALEKYTKHSVSSCRKNWTEKEKGELAKGLKRQLQETLIREATDCDLEGTTDDINTVLESINNLEITPEMIRQFLPKVNWDQLDIKNRSAAECKARWMSLEDPLINKGDWTKAEDEYIRLVTKKESFIDWLDFAVSLGTNRTPFQCLVRYQRSWNREMLESEWTKEDKDQLQAAVDLFGKQNWQSVANVFQGRTGTQCSNKLNKSRERKTWSLEEVERLKIAMKFFGSQWYRIARFVPGRTGSQCQAKWKETLDPEVKRGKWTEEEDAKLIEATKEHGIGDWVKIASYIPRRDRKQCKKRWERLNPDLMPLLKKARQLEREATIRNFVDREAERPDLDKGDFLELAKVSLDQEQPRIASPKKKYKPRQKKSDTERQPKRRRKGIENICESEANNGGEARHNESQDYVKEKKQSRKRKNVAETLSNNSSATKKLKPRRKPRSINDAEVPIDNQTLN